MPAYFHPMIKSPRYVVAALVLLGASDSGVVAQERFFDWTDLQFPPEEYEARRMAFMESLAGLEGSSGVVLIPSANGLSHGDTFRQMDDFNYLTGLELPKSVLVLDMPTRRATLFVPEQDSRFENPGRRNDFPGRPLATDPDLPLRSGIPGVRNYEQLGVALLEWQRLGVRVFVSAGQPGVIRRVATGLVPDWDPQLLSLYHLQTTYPRLRIENAYDAMARVRMIKSPLEVDAMRRAAAATVAAIRATARRVRDGVTERDMEATFEAACKEEGAQRIAFASIVKSGPNSLWPWRILSAHYDRRNRAMRDGELVILDVGCEVGHYVSDVGRTLPVSGRFTPEQRRVLEMEVGIADAIIERIRPGVTLGEIQELVNSMIPVEHRPYMQTGLFFGHHIGLSTGDPALYDAPLKPGMTFTVEPWYYNHDTGISVFTEDEVLVTDGGAELLTGDLPRSPAELERLIR